LVDETTTKEILMAFLSKKWLRALWGVEQPSTKIAEPIDCDACRIARRAGGDACDEHAHHVRPHTYDVGHDVEWGGVFDNPLNTFPTRHSESIH
jgi:hypothetical protein